MQVMQDAAVRDRLQQEGMVAVVAPSAEYAQTIQTETRKWEAVMQRAGVKRE
jgi:tripartite-type tricarboxylate transporter receptor subunit TctC